MNAWVISTFWYIITVGVMWNDFTTWRFCHSQHFRAHSGELTSQLEQLPEKKKMQSRLINWRITIWAGCAGPDGKAVKFSIEDLTDGMLPINNLSMKLNLSTIVIGSTKTMSLLTTMKFFRIWWQICVRAAQTNNLNSDKPKNVRQVHLFKNLKQALLKDEAQRNE